MPTSTPKLAPDDLIIVIPMEMMGGAEAGTPLPDSVISLIRTMATLGYWPVDFGEETERGQELWLTNKSPGRAIRQAEYFISMGGYV